MKYKNTIVSTVLTVIFLITQVSAVGAAPVTQDTGEENITGTIETITLETITETNETIVVVTILNDAGEIQIVTLSIEEATTLELVTVDDEGNISVNEVLPLTKVEINSEIVFDDGTEKKHPVGLALADFFTTLFKVDYDTIMEKHTDGVGFGVIAQALWMTNALDGNTKTFSAILDAKQSKDFSAIKFEDGSTPQNWGQFRKAIFKDPEKAKENLGTIMSGHANNTLDQPEVQLDGQEELKFNGKIPSKPGKDKNKSNNKNKEKKNNK